MFYDLLELTAYPNRDKMGRAAAGHVESLIAKLLNNQQTIRMVFAAAPSQNEFLSYLRESSKIEWDRIIAFHMDEYIGVNPERKESFANYLSEQLFTRVPFKAVHLLNGTAPNPEAEAERYSRLLMEAPVDIVCMGVGENGHIAFNDPAVALFNDTLRVKIVELDMMCRQQQVNDGCFETLKYVPERALTLTIPMLMSAKYLSVVVPSIRKARAVSDLLTGEISERVPASIIRTHVGAKMFLDSEAASLIPEIENKIIFNPQNPG